MSLYLWGMRVKGGGEGREEMEREGRGRGRRDGEGGGQEAEWWYEDETGEMGER